MRQNAPIRRTWLLKSLLAERQVYVRSGFDGHYVSLSRSFQAAVALGLVAFIAWLALASYGAIANYVETRAQRETIARLQNEGPAAAAALAEAQAARERAERLAEASAAEAGDLRAALDRTDARVQEASAQLRRLQTERDALLEQFAGSTGEEAAPQAVAGLRAQLEAATRLIEELSGERVELRASVERLLTMGGARRTGIAEPRQAEPGSNNEARLAGGLSALKGAGGEPALAGVEQAILGLESNLLTAKSTIASIQQDLGDSKRLVELNAKLGAARDRIDALETNLEGIKAHQSALRAALAAQSQLPPPPKPD